MQDCSTKTGLVPNPDIIQLSLKFGCSLHNAPLITYEIQPLLAALSVTFANFLLCYLLCPAVSHVMSSSFLCSVQLASPQARANPVAQPFACSFNNNN